MIGRTRRLAFTLFEVAIALAIVSFAVVSVLLAFPAGLKAQQMARFRLLAATKAEEMVEAFNSTSNANPAVDNEAFQPWDVPVSYRSEAFDLEQRLSSHRFGIMPLPTDLARRLDSDNDEIQRLLDDGGYVYYSQPQANTNTEERSIADKSQNALESANEAQKLVFAVVGCAQDNAIHMLSRKCWPYYTPYPSPPIHSLMYNEYLPTALNVTRFQWDYTFDRDWNNGAEKNDQWFEQSACVEEAMEASHDGETDPDIRKVFMWQENGTYYGFLPFAYGRFTGPPDSSTTYHSMLPDRGVPSRDSLIHYIQSAYWYAVQKGIDPGTYDPATPATIPTGFDASPEPWKQVQAMRFLAHATACATAWYTYSKNPNKQSDPYLEDGGPGVVIPQVTLDGKPGPASDIKLTADKIRYFHDRCLNMVMKFCAENPYDWRVPRPTQRAIMMDHPLLEYDLFSPPLTGKITGSSIDAQQWKPIAAQPIEHPGVSWMYPDHTISPSTDTTTWGDPSHFTLTAPFKAAERCRQIVFWAVDWQSYIDFETAPSAAVDASKYPFAAPHKYTYAVNQGTAADGIAYTFDHAVGCGPHPDSPCGLEWADDQLFAFRNPEKVLTFKDDVSGMATGSDISQHLILNSVIPITNPDGTPGEAYDYPDRGRPPTQPNAPLIFSGRYGADRNFNLKLDRGPLPTSVRLRAVEVARLNYYDPRVPLMIR